MFFLDYQTTQVDLKKKNQNEKIKTSLKPTFFIKKFEKGNSITLLFK